MAMVAAGVKAHLGGRWTSGTLRPGRRRRLPLPPHPIRDTAYAGTPKATRAQLHQAFAEWLETSTGDRVVEYEEILGYHLEQAYRYRAELGPVDETARTVGDRAARRLLAAGHRATDRGDVPARVNLFGRVLDLLGP